MRKSSPANPAWVAAASTPGKGVYHAPPVASSTTKLEPGPPVNSDVASNVPQTEDGCCAAGTLESSAPMVRKLSYAKSGKKFKKAELMPKAFQVVLAGSLYQDPEDEVNTSGLACSPEHEDK